MGKENQHQTGAACQSAKPAVLAGGLSVSPGNLPPGPSQPSRFVLRSFGGSRAQVAPITDTVPDPCSSIPLTLPSKAGAGAERSGPRSRHTGDRRRRGWCLRSGTPVPQVVDRMCPWPSKRSREPRAELNAHQLGPLWLGNCLFLFPVQNCYLQVYAEFQ